MLDTILCIRVLRDRPLMVMALARPEVSELFPLLWAERDLQILKVGPLGRRASERLVTAALGSGVHADTVTRIVERSAGNPLYLEELIRAVSEGHEEALPETVLAMVQTRLEKLEPDARHVLRAASVFGKTFWQGGVRALIGPEAASTLPTWLDLLVHRELIGARRSAVFSGEREYTFRHSVVREGAYGMLTPADLAAGHQLAGAWLESWAIEIRFLKCTLLSE